MYWYTLKELVVNKRNTVEEVEVVVQAKRNANQRFLRLYRKKQMN
jgi:hypothetical protein